MYLKKNIRSYEEWTGSSILVEGKVESVSRKSTDYGERLNVIVKVKNITLTDGTSLPEMPRKVLLYFDLGGSGYRSYDPFDLKMGETIAVKGNIRPFSRATNEGMFDSLIYYNSLKISFAVKNASIREILYQGKYDRAGDLLYRIRLKAGGILDEALGDEEASLMKAMLLGEKYAPDEELKELYLRNGIAHVLCISGLHISLLGMALFKLLNKTPLGIKGSAVISFSAVLFYVLMTGVAASSLRALLMFGFSMAAILMGRTYDMLTSVSFILLCLLAPNPLYIYNSGFVFSFGCVIGIAVLMPTMVSKHVSQSKGFAGWAKNAVSTSLTILVISLPIYLYYYFQFPVYSVLLNFLVIPVMSILVTAGFLLILFSFIFQPAASLTGVLITGILGLFKMLSEYADSLPFHFFTPGKPSFLQVGIYVSVMVALYFHRKKAGVTVKVIACAAAVIILCLRTYGGCRFDVIDVGQGDGIFIRYDDHALSIGGVSDDTSVLIDCGSSTVSEVGKYRLIPFLKARGCRELDAVILTHLDSDHTSGVKELLTSGKKEGIKVKRVYVPYPSKEYDSEKYEELLTLCEDAGISLQLVAQGQTLKDGPFSLYTEAPNKDGIYDDPNEMSVVTTLEYKGKRALFTGDIEGKAEDDLTKMLEGKEDYDLLKVAHHGSKNSTSDGFLNVTEPTVSVISVGKDNSYGHPSDEVLKRLKDRGSIVYRTDKCGMISIKITGKGIYIKPFLR